MSANYPWESQFQALYDRVKAGLQNGEKSLEKLFNDADRSFLKSIGSKPIEIFDAADDFVRHSAPLYEDMLEIHRMRYEYFTKVQGGVFPPLTQTYREKAAALGGITWLPRAIDKVRAKREGRLLDDFFYPCSGDRSFLKQIKMTPVTFFKLVCNSKSDEEVLQHILRNKT